MAIPILQSEREPPETALSVLDRRIIQATLQGLPLDPQPYHRLAEQLEISVDELLARLQRLRNQGVIQRIAAVPDYTRVGLLIEIWCGWDVPDADVRRVGHLLAQQAGVHECAVRPRLGAHWPYNLTLRLRGRHPTEVAHRLRQIRELLGPQRPPEVILKNHRIIKDDPTRHAFSEE